MRAGAGSGFIIEIMAQGHRATRAGDTTRGTGSRQHTEITSKPATGTGTGPVRAKAVAAFCGQCGTLSVKKPKKGGERGLGRDRTAHAIRSAQGTGAAVRFLRIYRMLLLLPPLVGPHKSTSRTWSAINVNVEIFMMQPPWRGTSRHDEASGIRQRAAGEGSVPPFLCAIFAYELRT